jgi:hypothetical protein
LVIVAQEQFVPNRFRGSKPHSGKTPVMPHANLHPHPDLFGISRCASHAALTQVISTM